MVMMSYKKWKEKRAKDKHWKTIIKNADNIIYYYTNIPAKDKRVNLHVHNLLESGYPYYDRGGRPANLGDELAIPICKWMLDKKNIKIDKPISKKKHLITVGSGVLASFQNATIWGSGIMYDGLKGAWWEEYYKATHRNLDIRAVRGPMTREMLIKLGHNCPEVYGDPGILMPLIYQPNYKIINREEKEYAIIPQFTTENEVRKYFTDDMIISMNTNDYKSVIDKIVSCKVVYSSSLHGIILAESYGIPAIFFRGIPSIIDFKYKDYYASTGRFNVPMANSLAEAFGTTPPELPQLSNLQKGLIDAFPYDLWND